EAVVIYDGDKAGEAASLRGLEVFLEGGMNIRLVRLPQGYDPDDFIRKEGAKAFSALLAEAQDFFDYKLETLLGRFNRSESLGLMKMTGEMLETFSKVKSPVLLDRYLRKLGAVLGIDENSLRSELSKMKNKMPAREEASSGPGALPAGMHRRDAVLLLALMIENETLRETAFEKLSDEDFEDRTSRETFRLLKTMAGPASPAGGQKNKIQWPRVLNHLEDEGFKQELVAASEIEWQAEQKAKAFEDCLNQLKAKQLERRLAELRRQIARAEKEGDRDISEYVRKYQTLLKTKR
ncbi:MAG: hypothetical protein L0Z48_08895, partial [candidate division Zixibacteria bacterium]|nr:hypothetical protein [candidate division Zixibacteria bacterium]